MGRGSDRLKLEDVVSLRYDLVAAEGRLLSTADTLQVLFEDGFIAAVWKPPGIDTNGPCTPGRLTLEAQLPRAMQLSQEDDRLERAVTVHRLDRATCGVVICAKTSNAREGMYELFAARKVHKRCVT